MSAVSINEISAESRSVLGTLASKKLRAQGKVPAVVYGHGIDPIHVVVNARDIHHALDAGARIVTLKTASGAESALFKDVQYDVYGKEILHVDFARVSLDEAVTVEVEVELHGEPADEGVVDHELHNIEIECRADAIPERLRVEIGGLKVGDLIRVEDLKLPQGVKPITAADTVVVAIHAPSEAVEVAAEAEEAAEPELIGGKAEEEEAEEEE